MSSGREHGAFPFFLFVISTSELRGLKPCAPFQCALHGAHDAERLGAVVEGGADCRRRRIIVGVTLDRADAGGLVRRRFIDFEDIEFRFHLFHHIERTVFPQFKCLICSHSEFLGSDLVYLLLPNH